MDQQQIEVRFSVGTKLLISVVSLLFVVIVFLNISTILLFKSDKIAYTYQSQASEAVLTSREFVSTIKHSLDTLRATLSSVDPRAKVTPDQIGKLQSIIDSQAEIIGLSIHLVNINSGSSEALIKVSKAKEAKELNLKVEDYQVTPAWMQKSLPSLLKNAYSFVNLSKAGGLPLLGVLFADLKLKNNPSGLPVSIGLVSLKGFGGDLTNTKLTIATRSGWILFDSDPEALFSKENVSANPLFQTALSSQIMNGAQEFDYNHVHYLGSYVLPGFDLVVTSTTEWKKAMRATYILVEKFVLLGATAVGAAIIFAILFSKTLTAPLGKLYEATREIASGNFLVQLNEKGRDEIAALSKSFNTMSSKIQDLIQESMKKVQLENELAIASTVQQTLIPPPDFSSQNILIKSHYQSASECGGDWWGFFGVDNKLAVMIADATGHGLPCALITASARSCFSVMAKLAQEDPEFSFSPSAMLSYANRVIYDASVGQIMMTFFVAVFDFDTKTLTYSSAAHNPPWLFTKESGSYALKSLVAVGQRLGESRDIPPFEEKTIPITSEDILFLYTDGLTEGKNPSGDMYGRKRARKILEANLNNGPQGLIQAIMDDFMSHNGTKPLDDDVTIAAAMVLKHGQV